MRFTQRGADRDTPRTYVTVKDPVTKKAKGATIHGATPDQVLKKLKELIDQEAAQQRPASAAAA